jgi:hypothetical protein
MKQKRKKPVARTPEAVAKYKELFLEQLELGCSPGVAARNEDQNASSEVLGMRFCVLPNGNIDVTTQGITVSAGSQHRHCAYLHVSRSVIMRCRS